MRYNNKTITNAYRRD